MIIKRTKRLNGSIEIPGDKSISHRAIMFGALAHGTTEVTHFLQGADCLSTISCFQKLGISIENTGTAVYIQGKGIHGLQAPNELLDTGNSGTTTRMISGILAGQTFTSELNGDASIQKRPMNRIITPLAQMGAQIESLHQNGCAPLRIYGTPLKAIDYHSPVASAQVKSAVLLAGMYADGITSVTEPERSRNHTELMLEAFGANVTVHEKTVWVEPEPYLTGQKIEVPGDISSAAYFLAAGLLVPQSEILIKNVGVNPTRDGILKVIAQMGGNVTRQGERIVSGEPVCDLLVRSSTLHGTTIGGSLIPTLIDELPVIAVLGAYAQGTTIIKNAQELKVKESNRIDIVVNNLNAMGADVSATEDGMIIHGGRPLHGAILPSHADHRIAMSFAIAALCADSPVEIEGASCVNISYPDFYEDLNRLRMD